MTHDSYPPERDQERLRELQAHPDVRELLSLDPEQAGASGGDTGCAVSIAASGVVAALACALFLGLVFPPLAVLPLVLLIVGVLALLTQRNRRPPWWGHSLESHAAHVLDVRARLTEGTDRPARSRHHVELLLANGERRRLEAAESLAPELAAGAFGVAYVRGPWLIGFRPVVLPPR